MEKINYIDPVSWLEEEIEIKKIDFNKLIEKNSELIQYIEEDEQVRTIIEKISEKSISSKELTILISKLEIHKMKSSLIEYLKEKKEKENKIIELLYQINLISNDKKNQDIKIEFSWLDLMLWNEIITNILQSIISYDNEYYKYIEEIGETQNYKKPYIITISISNEDTEIFIKNISIKER